MGNQKRGRGSVPRSANRIDRALNTYETEVGVGKAYKEEALVIYIERDTKIQDRER